MRHRRKGKQLSRTQSHKKALLRNLTNQVIEHKEIRTTLAKAKEARKTVERMITYAKRGSVHHRRLAFAFLQNKDTVSMLFDEIAGTYAERQGGYTRIYKLGKRPGDAADMSLLQLVGFEKFVAAKKKALKKKGKTEAEKGAETSVPEVEQETASKVTPAEKEPAKKPKGKTKKSAEKDKEEDKAAENDQAKSSSKKSKNITEAEDKKESKTTAKDKSKKKK